MPSLLLALIYLVYVSLGLPDSLLGAAWPAMHADLGAGVGSQSFITIAITACTVVSSLLTAKLVRRFGTGRLVAGSVALTVIAALGFSASSSLWHLMLLAVPYGLGAGAVDSALNNFVAVRYGERHLNWLHACWGIGTSASPLVMGFAIMGPLSWRGGYLAVGAMLATVAAAVVFSLPRWKSADAAATDTLVGAGRVEPDAEKPSEAVVSYRKALSIPGAKTAIGAFGCYSAFEAVCAVWATSYLVFARGVSATEAACMFSLFYVGITAGRLVSGLVAPRVGNEGMIRLGQLLVAVGLACIAFGQGIPLLAAGLLIVGLGCAPICPCTFALTPGRFGVRASQTMISLQMACAYAIAILMLPVCSLVVHLGASALVPMVLAAILAAMACLGEKTNKKLSRRTPRRGFAFEKIEQSHAFGAPLWVCR